MKEMSILPVQLTLMIRTFGGICILLVPAKSAPAYEHQLQQNAIILGSKVDVLTFFTVFPGAVVLGVIMVRHGPPWITSEAIISLLLSFLNHHPPQSSFEENGPKRN